MNCVKTIKKLQTAINMKGYKLLYCTTEFFSKDMNRPVIIYYIKQAVFEGESVNNRVLFKSASQLRVVFFMRDLFQCLNEGDDFETSLAIAIDKQKNYVTKREVIQGKESVSKWE